MDSLLPPGFSRIEPGTQALVEVQLLFEPAAGSQINIRIVIGRLIRILDDGHAKSMWGDVGANDPVYDRPTLVVKLEDED